MRGWLTTEVGVDSTTSISAAVAIVATKLSINAVNGPVTEKVLIVIIVIVIVFVSSLWRIAAVLCTLHIPHLLFLAYCFVPLYLYPLCDAFYMTTKTQGDCKNNRFLIDKRRWYFTFVYLEHPIKKSMLNFGQKKADA